MCRVNENSSLISFSCWDASKTYLLNYLFPLCFLFILLGYIGYLSAVAFIRIELDSASSAELQVFWTEEKIPFSEANSKTIETQTGKQSYWFFINDFSQSTIFRIDPTNKKTNLKIHSIELFSAQHLPVDFNLFYDSLSTSDIEIAAQQSPQSNTVALASLSDDPQIKIRAIHVRTHVVSLMILVFLLILSLRNKTLLQVLRIILGLLSLYVLLGLNQSTVSFRANSEKAGEVKVFWRDEGASYSNTRARQVTIEPGDHTYKANIGNMSNIEVLYLEVAGGQKEFIIDEITIVEPGFKQFTFSDTETESIIEKKAALSRLLLSIIIFLLFSSFVFFLVHRYPGNQSVFYAKIFPKLMRGAFFIGALLVFNLAWQADYNIHPDENAHIESIKYYSEYWDPPKVGDIRALEAYQEPWALSRLDDLGISYFFAGKFRNIVQTLFSDDTFSSRAFNALIFLLFFVLTKDKRLLLFLVPLLCTPQVWYLYAYANRGGFVLFISLLLAWQLVNNTSTLNAFLQGSTILTHWKKALYPGLLLGILAIEQTNYILFILFFFSFLLWRILFISEKKQLMLYKCFIVMIIGGSIFLIRYGVDVSINGFNKGEQRIAYAEQNAGPGFKPSIASSKDSYSGLRLKDKGVSALELFQPEWKWHKMTFKSFTGFYGYYAEYSPKWYYAYVLIIYLIVLLVMIKHSIFHENWRYNLFSVVSLTAVAGGVLMGFLFSWLYDFQPQGRYIFPIIPILLVYFWIMFPRLERPEKSILLTSVIILVLLSFYSFNEVALNYLVS